MVNIPFVSIIIPCRNEVRFIEKCIDSVIYNDYPKDKLEILIMDGVSEDGTREIVKEYQKKYHIIKLLDNPKKITPCALNIGIKHAKGQIIMRIDAHSTYEKNYISKCIKYLEEYNADNVGGIWKIVPRENTIIGKTIVFSLSHPFGIGNTHYRLGPKKPRWVDTVPFFCCKKEVFKEAGLFNEKLPRGQDMEFSLRLKKAGFKTLLVPEIVSYYYTRSDLKSFCKHNFKNGVWAILPFKFSEHMPVSWRHLVPLVFVSSLISTGILAFFLPYFAFLFLFIFVFYFLTNFYFSTKIALKKKDRRYLFIMPVTFAALHIGYGLGSVWGVIKLLRAQRFWNKLLGRKVGFGTDAG